MKEVALLKLRPNCSLTAEQYATLVDKGWTIECTVWRFDMLHLYMHRSETDLDHRGWDEATMGEITIIGGEGPAS